LEKSLETTVVSLLVELLDLPSAEPNDEETPIYLKYVIRCITSCVRHQSGIDQLCMHGKGTHQLLRLLQFLRDEEIVANTAKILRLLLRSKQVSENNLTNF
jgi:hypothetical protein